ncbi:hypothetical protein ACIF8W_02735 [Streptomyces sp. NPDC085639]|uniref:hypothetical protein n=1 Tax=Streptomyces sp. NPDC085639 TaxID=3365734 RepID=UPI0037CE2A8B
MEERDAMEALVFQGSGQTARQDVPDPGIEDTADAIVEARLTAVRALGVDVVTEAVGCRAFRDVTRMVRFGGRVADIGALEVARGGARHDAVTVAATRP